MPGRAPRRVPRPRRRPARGAFLALALAAGSAFAAAAQQVKEVRLGPASARFELPTHRYGHAIMGDLPEWGRLCLTLVQTDTCVTLPETSVFEDIAPRLHDLDGDAVPEVVVVQSSVSGGAALVVYDLSGDRLERIATPPIGRRNRWLAPAAIGDLDGDGHTEIAYVDRPHLAKRLRVWRYEGGRLVHVADRQGLTNHRIGWDFIVGGLRDCGAGPEVITADAGWRAVMATRLDRDGTLTSRQIAPYSGPQSVADSLDCGG